MSFEKLPEQPTQEQIKDAMEFTKRARDTRIEDKLMMIDGKLNLMVNEMKEMNERIKNLERAMVMR